MPSGMRFASSTSSGEKIQTNDVASVSANSRPSIAHIFLRASKFVIGLYYIAMLAPTHVDVAHAGHADQIEVVQDLQDRTYYFEFFGRISARITGACDDVGCAGVRC